MMLSLSLLSCELLRGEPSEAIESRVPSRGGSAGAGRSWSERIRVSHDVNLLQALDWAAYGSALEYTGALYVMPVQPSSLSTAVCTITSRRRGSEQAQGSPTVACSHRAAQEALKGKAGRGWMRDVKEVAFTSLADDQHPVSTLTIVLGGRTLGASDTDTDFALPCMVGRVPMLNFATHGLRPALCAR